ncbi:MAG: hypothetical protein BHV94_07385 [Clostridiales bacterium 59_14]|nr:MAG: hypothetical protein BHV94_07385 [Clostridiales bacterium 59_14]
MSIISQNSNDVYYAYTRGRFWRWDESARVWKESHLLAQKFDKAKAAEKHLTPEAFLTSDEFIPMDDYELPERMLTALREAKPCKNAPIEPVEEESSSDVSASCICSTCTCGGCKEECFGNCCSCGHPVQECNSYQTEGEKHLTPTLSEDIAEPEVPGTQTAQEKPLTTVPDAMRPAFDYSGLTDQTVEDLHFAENEYRHGKQMAERGLVHMGNAIAAAHDALCGVVAQCDNGEDGACRTMRKARNNQHSEDTFKSWCVSIGITKDTAYRLLQVSALLDGSSPRQQKILKELSPTLLYAVAKPSAPAELVEKVKSGDITTNKQYQEAMAQIKAEKDRAAAAEAREEEAWNMVSKAQDEAQTAKNDLDAALADVQGLDEENARLKAEKEKAERSYNEMYESRIAANLQRQKAEAERDRAEARAKDAENQLVGSRQVAEAAKLRGDKLKAENDALKKQPITAVVDKEEVERQAREMAAEMTADLRAQLEQAASGSEQDAHSSYDNVLLADRSLQNIGKMVVPSLRRLPPEQREQLTNMLVHTLGQIQGEVSKCL